jgi:hypothetical protein
MAMAPIWIVLGGALLAWGVVRAINQRKHHRRLWRDLAGEHHLRYANPGEIDYLERFGNLALISQGHDRRIGCALVGRVDAGGVTLLEYSYDLGFGVRRSTRHAWVAVIETPQQHPSWTVEPALAVDAVTNDRQTMRRLGDLLLTADRPGTLADLTRDPLRKLLDDLARPASTWLEVHGPLVAVAAPFEPNPALPGQLLRTARKLARTLADQPDLTQESPSRGDDKEMV